MAYCINIILYQKDIKSIIQQKMKNEDPSSDPSIKQLIVTHLKQILNAEYQLDQYKQFIEHLLHQPDFKEIIQRQFTSQQELRNHILNKIPKGAVIYNKDEEANHIIFDQQNKKQKQKRAYFGDDIKEIIQKSYHFWNILRIDCKIQKDSKQQQDILRIIRQNLEQISKQQKISKQEQQKIQQLEKELSETKQVKQKCQMQIDKYQMQIQKLKQETSVLQGSKNELQSKENKSKSMIKFIKKKSIELVAQINNKQLMIKQISQKIIQLDQNLQKIDLLINQKSQILNKLIKQKSDYKDIVTNLNQLQQCRSFQKLIYRTIQLYTGPLFKFLNSAFASNHIATKVRMRHLLQVLLFNFRQKIVGRNLKQITCLYRNIKLPQHLLSLYKKDKTLYFTHLTSFSRFDNDNFGKLNEQDVDKCHVYFKLSLPNFEWMHKPAFYSGLSVSQISMHKKQWEVLVFPFQFFKITSVKQEQYGRRKKNMRYLIQIQELESKELINKIEQPTKEKVQLKWNIDEEVLIKEVSQNIKICEQTIKQNQVQVSKLIQKNKQIILNHVIRYQKIEQLPKQEQIKIDQDKFNKIIDSLEKTSQTQQQTKKSLQRLIQRLKGFGKLKQNVS